VLIPIEIIKGHDFRVSLLQTFLSDVQGQNFRTQYKNNPKSDKSFVDCFLLNPFFFVLFIVAYLQGCWVNRLETIGNHFNHPLFYRHFLHIQKRGKSSQLYHTWSDGRQKGTLTKKFPDKRDNQKRSYFISLSFHYDVCCYCGSFSWFLNYFTFVFSVCKRYRPLSNSSSVPSFPGMYLSPCNFVFNFSVVKLES